jgi:predicted ABC-type ATPase
MPTPFLLVVAGPNGSGKTTLTDYLRRSGIDFGVYINPDDIAPTLSGSYDERVRAAQLVADEKRDDCLANRRDFSFETVMSHPGKIEFMHRARDAGFEITLFFVGTETPEINVARVGQRVALGGHDVPDDKIVARHGRSMALLPAAISAAHRIFLFDNSAVGTPASASPRLLVEIDNRDGRPKIVRGALAGCVWASRAIDPVLG